MTESDISVIARDLSQEIGLRFSGSMQRNSVGVAVEFTLVELDRIEGLALKMQFGWRSLVIDLLPGNYAAQLISEMGNADPASKNTFAVIAGQIEQNGANLSLAVNGERAEVSRPEFWPNGWRSIALSLKKSPVTFESEESLLEGIRVWSRAFTSLLVALLPVQSAEESVSLDVTGYPEGACVQVKVNRYERDRRNRFLCLQAKGFSCTICGFDFAQRYGNLGKDFIHVHHVVPVSQLGDGYVINPIADLVPICPNCHAMIHRHNPPLAVDELKTNLREAKLSQDH